MIDIFHQLLAIIEQIRLFFANVFTRFPGQTSSSSRKSANFGHLAVNFDENLAIELT